jgi:hypothetical protein
MAAMQVWKFSGVMWATSRTRKESVSQDLRIKKNSSKIDRDLSIGLKSFLSRVAEPKLFASAPAH